MHGRRIDRIEEQLRMELSQIIERHIQDPRIGLTTVTHVKLSSDLQHARVFVSSLGGEAERRKTLEGLKSASSFIRRSLSQRLQHLKRIPELKFSYDDSIERGSRIEELLEQMREEHPGEK